MSRKSVLGILALGAILVGAGVALALILRHRGRLHMQWHSRVTVKRDLRHLARCVSSEAFRPKRKPLDLPRGNIRELYAWVMHDRQCDPPFAVGSWDLYADHKTGTFRDLWGNEFVYRFPARRPQAIFDLYSVGPNGVDDSGGMNDSIGKKATEALPFGDDVTCVPWADFKTYSDEFKGGVVEPKWVTEHIDTLQRDPKTGKIIGAPPEKLENVRSSGDADFNSSTGSTPSSTPPATSSSPQNPAPRPPPPRPTSTSTTPGTASSRSTRTTTNRATSTPARTRSSSPTNTTARSAASKRPCPWAFQERGHRNRFLSVAPGHPKTILNYPSEPAPCVRKSASKGANSEQKTEKKEQKTTKADSFALPSLTFRSPIVF